MPGDATGCHAIVLAGGSGRRFGSGKLLAPWQGRPLICSAVRTALAARVDSVIVVVGHDADAITQALAPLKEDRLRVVLAQDWQAGMSASLRAGIAALGTDALAVVVLLGDMPAIPPGLADRLLDAVIAGAPAACATSSQGPAHPAAFAASQFPALRMLQGDRGGRSVLNALGDGVVAIPSDDPGVVFDIDRPIDLKRDIKPGTAA